jgi:hypothetical protein
MQITSLLAALTLLGGAIAHPGGHDHGPEELQKRDALWQHAKRSIADCSSSLMARGVSKRAIARRSELAAKLREKRGLSSSEFPTLLVPSRC